jgi:hypothetical protein
LIHFYKRERLLRRREERSSSCERAGTPTWPENAPVGARLGVRIHSLGICLHWRLTYLAVRPFHLTVSDHKAWKVPMETRD